MLDNGVPEVITCELKDLVGEQLAPSLNNRPVTGQYRCTQCFHGVYIPRPLNATVMEQSREITERAPRSYSRIFPQLAVNSTEASWDMAPGDTSK